MNNSGTNDSGGLSGVGESKGSTAPQSAQEPTDGRDTAGRFTAGNAIGPRFQEGNEAALIHGGRRMQTGQGTALDESERFTEGRPEIWADVSGRSCGCGQVPEGNEA